MINSRSSLSPRDFWSFCTKFVLAGGGGGARREEEDQRDTDGRR